MNSTASWPVAWDELRSTWALRDLRYGVRKTHGFFQPLTIGEKAAIRAYRRNEIQHLPPAAQGAAWAAPAAWASPVPKRPADGARRGRPRAPQGAGAGR